MRSFLCGIQIIPWHKGHESNETCIFFLHNVSTFYTNCRLSTFDHRGFCYLKILGARHFLSGEEEVLDRLVTLQVVEETLYRQALWTTAGDPGGAQIWREAVSLRVAAAAEGVGRAQAGHWC